jgi:hypothetical protein
MAVLRLLFHRRINDYRNAYVSSGELESLTGMTPDEMGFTLWFLREKGAIMLRDNSTDHQISAVGIELIESTEQATTGALP